MACLICGSSTEAFLRKEVGEFGLDTLDYSRCSHCGFVLSETHAEMSEGEWEALNEVFHRSYQGSEENPVDPHWLPRLQAQSEALIQVDSAGLLPWGRALDYACGDGKLAEYLAAKSAIRLECFDRYMPSRQYLQEVELVAGAFDFLITTSVFEHLRERRHFDEIRALLAPGGVMALHTLVCESVPRDPSWFYFLPVHCAFHTNKSMSILLGQWGYRSSIYHVPSRLWFFFEQEFAAIEPAFSDLKNTAESDWHGKDGFMDYWK